MAVSFLLLWNQIFKNSFMAIIFYFLFFFYSLRLFFFNRSYATCPFFCARLSNPLYKQSGLWPWEPNLHQDNHNFRHVPTISVCMCGGGMSVCVAQLLSRWNAHYAADDNSVESKVCASLCLLFPLSLVNSILTPSYLCPSVCPGSLSLSLPFLPADSVTLLCSPWLEASKDQYHFPLCSFRATHTHTLTNTPCGPLCVWSGGWVDGRCHILLIFFSRP